MLIDKQKRQKKNLAKVISNDCVEFALKVSTHASKDKVIGWVYDTKQQPLLKISTVAVPEAGKANKHIMAFLAKLFNISKSQITIVSGLTSRTKMIRLSGLDSVQIQNIAAILYNECMNELSS